MNLTDLDRLNYSQKMLLIKLGEGYEWFEQCVHVDQTVKIDFRTVNHEICANGEWEKVKEHYIHNRGKTKGVASRFSTQLKHFYESDESALWIAKSKNDDRFWWCQAFSEIELSGGNQKMRNVNGKWNSQSVKGTTLLKKLLPRNIQNNEMSAISEMNDGDRTYILSLIIG